jgi:ribonuclease-3
MSGTGDPVVVFRTHSDVEANIVIGLLDAHGIEAIVSSDVSHSIFPLTVNGLGEVRVSVGADRADAARRLIADFGQGADEALQDTIAYRFRDRGLLEHALTHRSRAHEDVTGGVADNESLEFLGDAVLGFVAADQLFHRFPDCDEGQKSKLKASLVSTAALARLAARLGLGEHLLLGRGEEKSGGRRKQALLADSYEALIAALYLDGGMEVAQAFIVREFAEQLAGMSGSDTVTGDHKSALQERLQRRGDPLPEYLVAAEEGPAHRRLFRIDVRVRGTVLASAEGRTKKEAEQEAARLALADLDTPPADEGAPDA